jgi:hypothetical protein
MKNKQQIFVGRNSSGGGPQISARGGPCSLLSPTGPSAPLRRGIEGSKRLGNRPLLPTTEDITGAVIHYAALLDAYPARP